MRSVIAFRFILHRLRQGTFRREPVASAGQAAVRFRFADHFLPRRNELTSLPATARALTRAALSIRPAVTPLRRRVLLQLLFIDNPRVATAVGAFVLVVTAIAFLAGFDDLVPAERSRRRGEAVPFFALLDGVENARNVPHAAHGKLAVVRPIAARRRCEHDEVPVQPAGPTVRRVVVGRSEIVADLVRERQLGYFRRNSTVVVNERYYPGVEGALRRLVHSADGLRVGFVFLADPAGGSGSGGDPR